MEMAHSISFNGTEGNGLTFPRRMGRQWSAGKLVLILGRRQYIGILKHHHERVTLSRKEERRHHPVVPAANSESVSLVIKYSSSHLMSSECTLWILLSHKLPQCFNAPRLKKCKIGMLYSPRA